MFEGEWDWMDRLRAALLDRGVIDPFEGLNRARKINPNFARLPEPSDFSGSSAEFPSLKLRQTLIDRGIIDPQRVAYFQPSQFYYDGSGGQDADNMPPDLPPPDHPDQSNLPLLPMPPPRPPVYPEPLPVPVRPGFGPMGPGPWDDNPYFRPGAAAKHRPADALKYRRRRGY